MLNNNNNKAVILSTCLCLIVVKAIFIWLDRYKHIVRAIWDIDIQYSYKHSERKVTQAPLNYQGLVYLSSVEFVQDNILVDGVGYNILVSYLVNTSANNPNVN